MEVSRGQYFVVFVTKGQIFYLCSIGAPILRLTDSLHNNVFVKIQS